MIVKFFTDINLSKMKNFLYFDMMQKILGCLVEDQALGTRFQPFQTAFVEAFARLDEAMLISRRSLLTPEIQRLDAQRVQEWRLIRAAVKEQEKMTDTGTAEAARFVMSLITRHGDVPQMKVTERTGALTNLAQDLTQKYAAEVEALGLKEFAERMAAANADYLALYEERLHKWSEYTTGEVQAARERTDAALENLLIMVAAGTLTDGPEPFRHFTEFVNEAIKVAKIAMGVSTTRPDGDGSGAGSGSEGGSGSGSEGGSTGGTGTGGSTGGSGSTGGGSTGGSGTGGSGSGSAQKYTVAWYDPIGNPIVWYELYPGDPIPAAPECPEGYYWHPYPTTMPARDLDIIPEPIKG